MSRYSTEERRYFQEARRAPRLSLEQERALLRRWQQAGDLKARNDLVMSNLRVAFYEAARYSKYRIPLEDLVGQANIGTLKAADDFDTDEPKGVPFHAWARKRMRSEIRRYIAKNWDQIGLAERHAEFLFAVVARKDDPDAAAQAYATLSDTSRAKVELEEAKFIYDHFVASDRHLELDRPAYHVDEPERESDRLADTAPSAEDRLAEEDEYESRVAALQKALQTLTPRELAIFNARRLADEPVNMRILEKEIGNTRKTIRDTLKKADRKVFAAMLGENSNFRVILEERRAPKLKAA